MSNGLGPNQDPRCVGPDLGPNCLQRLSADDKSRSYQANTKLSILLSAFYGVIFLRNIFCTLISVRLIGTHWFHRFGLWSVIVAFIGHTHLIAFQIT